MIELEDTPKEIIYSTGDFIINEPLFGISIRRCNLFLEIAFSGIKIRTGKNAWDLLDGTIMNQIRTAPDNHKKRILAYEFVYEKFLPSLNHIDLKTVFLAVYKAGRKDGINYLVEQIKQYQQ